MEMDNDPDGWRAFKEHLRSESRAKKRHNLAYSTNLLRQNGVHFTSNNEYIHCVVSAGVETIDFWPTTGMWIVRGTVEKHRGVYKLLNFCKKASRK